MVILRRLGVVVLLFGIFSPFSVHAGLIINEVMYDVPGTDTNHEWIELYNDSSSSISLDGDKFNDGSNHGLNAPGTNGSTGSMSISPNGYAILAANAPLFLSDHPDFSGTVIDTVMNLNNTSATLSVEDSSGSTIDSITYSSSEGATGDGNSLQSFGSEFVAGTPTPGAVNTRIALKDPGEEPTVSSNEETQVDESILRYSGTLIFRTPITRGVPVLFGTLIVNPDRKVIMPGHYIWNMGDGKSKEYEGSQTFFYTYETPGDYLIVFEYREHSSQTPDVIIQKKIHVGDATVVISSVGPVTSSFVQISNKSGADVDLSGWSIVASGRNFVFPKNTIVLDQNSITFLPSITGFTGVDVSGATLVHNDGTIVSTAVKKSLFTNSTIETITKGTSFSETPSQMTDSAIESNTKIGDISSPVDPGEGKYISQKASVIDVVSDKDVSKVNIYYVLFGVLVLGSIGISLFIERKNRREEYGQADEFTLVE